ncbi:hypothetical protein L7F22_050157 [Adiantum nelumboides]|nr:hypothetical protein [Adiantum nelumboides]
MSSAKALDTTTELEIGTVAPAGHIDESDVEADEGTHTNNSDDENAISNKEDISTTDAKQAPAPAPTPTGPPDGGFAAWTVVLGGFITLFNSFGFLNNFAAFQTYYYTNTLRGYSNSDIAWIGAMQSFTILSANLVLGPIFDRYGPRPLLIGATFTFAFGCMMTSLADKYYQIFLAQGVVVGASLGAAFITPMACIMQWFDKKRPAALGIAISGSSIGGVVWPIVTKALLDNVSFGWTWRALGFIGLGLLPIAVVTVRMPPHVIEAKKKRGPQPVLALEAFKTPKYTAFTAVYVMFAMGLFPLLFYFPELTGHYGVSTDLQFYSISILNAFSFVGRMGLPILAQFTGVWNTSIVCIAICAISVFAFMAIDSPAGSVVAAGAFGFTSGGALSLVVACVPAVIPNFQKLGASMGQIFFVASFFALLTGPIAGWILATKPTGNWIAVEGYVGACLIVCAIGLVFLRLHINPDWKKKF